MAVFRASGRGGNVLRAHGATDVPVVDRELEGPAVGLGVVAAFGDVLAEDLVLAGFGRAVLADPDVDAGHVAHAALESIAWRVADILAVVAEQAPVEVLRVDGGLTRDPLLLQLQADAAGVPVERGAVDATAAGAAALAAVGAGLWASTREIAARIPGRRARRSAA